MRNRWLAFVSIGTLSLIVFAFFIVRLQPIKPVGAELSLEPGSLTEPSVTFVNPIRGNPTPTVTLVEFSDFECPACKQLDEAVTVILRTYPNEVKHVWKHLPNESAHPLAVPAAIAAQCAHRQGGFWAYHDQLFARQAFLSEEQFPQIATDIGLDTQSFQTCYDTRDTLPVVMRDFEEGMALGLVATPTIYINGTSYVGALTVEQLTSYVEQALAAR